MEGNTSNRDHNKNHKHTVKGRTTCKKTRPEQIPKGRRIYNKTGTKGAQTTDNWMEGRTEENEQWTTSTNTQTDNTHKKEEKKIKYRNGT